MSSQKERSPIVVYEDNHIIVLDKPPLLATMGVAEGEPSLANWVKTYWKEKYDKPGNVYLGIVSRLDAFTTGLIVMARTSKAASRLTSQFQKGQVIKQYSAIVEGKMDPSSGKFVDWVCKNDQRKRMEVVTEGTVGAKHAELEFEVIGHCRNLASDDLTAVSIRLLTGRKHQIRLQFSERGHSVWGDRKYDAHLVFPESGIALQSSFLKFEHPVRRTELSFRIDPPKCWKLGRFTEN